MRQGRALRPAVVIGGMLAVWSALLLGRGSFAIDMHEGDTLHLVDMLVRMVAGEWPHLDFMTPLGLLAVAPIAALMAAGLTAGQAILGVQVLVAAVLYPAVVRVAASRFAGGWAHLYGIVTLGLVLAVIHGGDTRLVSISMHYNRWAWALAYVALPLALLPALDRPRPLLDGAIIGLAMAALALTKMTYFVAFAPAAALVLLARGEGRMIVAATLAGLAVAGVVTLALGPGYWLAYAGDLLTVAGSDVRAEPGDSIDLVLAGPRQLTGVLLLVGTVILLRQTDRRAAGLYLFLLLPGFALVTWQNWGNDPQWLYLFGFLALALRPAPGQMTRFGLDAHRALTLVAVAVFANGAASAINVLSSPVHHFTRKLEDRVPLVPGDPRLADLLARQDRAHRRYIVTAADGPGSGFEALAASVEPADDPAVVAGEELPDCSTQSGFTNVFGAYARELEAAGDGGSAVFVADFLSPMHLFGNFRPVPGGAPWFYEGLAGIENADLLLVPLCPFSQGARAAAARAIEAGGWAQTELRRTDAYILYALPSRAEATR